LDHTQEVEDAFQATFIVLVHRAASLPEPIRLDAWLCGVARRVATRARMRAYRRRVREEIVVDSRELAISQPAETDFEISPVVRAEVAKLPEKYRRPIELCYWHGLSNEEAAGRLSCPTGTLKWRLSRAREILRGRLTRLGMASLLLFGLQRPAKASPTRRLSSRQTPPAKNSALPSSATSQPVSEELIRRTIRLAHVVRELTSPLTDLADVVSWADPRRRRWSRWWLYSIVVAAVVAGSLFSYPPVIRAASSFWSSSPSVFTADPGRCR
jgi:RNA polymerase sigma factor (sigma-70 family)